MKFVKQERKHMHQARTNRKKIENTFSDIEFCSTLVTPFLSHSLFFSVCQDIFRFFYLSKDMAHKYWNIIILSSIEDAETSRFDGENVCHVMKIYGDVKHIWFLFLLYVSVYVYKLMIIFVDIDLLYDVNHRKNGFICLTCSQFNDKYVGIAPSQV